MKNLITYLKALWSWGLDSQSTDVSLDCRSTVGSPSGLDAKWKQNPFMRFAVVLTIIFTIGSGNAWADYTVGFATSGSTVIASGGDYVSEAPRGGSTYIETDGLRFGKGNGTGYITVTLTSSGTYVGQIKASKITLKDVKRYGSDASVNVKTTVTYTDNATTEDNYTAPNSASDHDISLNSSKTIKSVKIESTTNGKRFYCKGFTVVAAAAPAYTITATRNNDSYGTVSVTGTTITATPNSGYRVMSGTDGYTVTSGSATVVNNGDNTFTVTPSSNCTVQINFESKGCTDHGASSITGGALSDDDHGPLHAYYDYSTSQILYTKSDLDLAVGKKGTIKSIYFEYSGAAAMAARSIKIYMSNTALTELTTGSYVPYASFIEVYDGTFSCSSAGWYEITLDTPFEYDGVGNLAVMVDDNTNSYQDDKNFKYHSATGKQIYKRQDDTDINPASWTPASAIDYRPNTKFCIQEADMTPATVTLMDNGATITEASAGAGVTLPSRAGCAGYTFAGWTKSWVAEQSSWTTTAPTIISAGTYYPTADEDLYPVYTKTEGSGSGFKLSLNSGGTDYYIGAKGSGNYMSAVTDAASAVVFTFATGYLSFDDSGTTTYISSEGDNTTLTVGTSTPGSTWTETGTSTVTYQSSATGSRYLGFNSGATPVRFAPYGNSYAHEFTKHSLSTTSYISVPDCCTPLGSVTGNIGTNTPTSVTLTWSDVSGAEKYQVKVPGSSSHNDWTDAVSGVSVTKSCGTAYTAYFRAIDTNGSNCSEGPESTLAIPAVSWTVTSTGITHATASPAIPSTTCSGFSTTISPATGYALPADITVTNASKSWNSSTGALSISSVTGNVSITITPTCVPPVISGDPADASYYVGDSPDALSVTATLASGTRTYLWKVSTNGGSTWSDAAGTNNTASYSGASLSTASAGTIKFKCIVGNSQGGCSVESGVATITVSNASYFPNGKTIFIQAHSTSAWTGGGCVKAWFHTAGGSETAQSTYWLFDATDGDAGKKLFATVVPATGDLPYLDIQRFAANCSDWWNKNGGCSYSDANGSNAIRSTGKNDDASDGNYVFWNGSGVTLDLHGDPSGDDWASSLASFSDQGSGEWTATYNNYAPANAAGESQDFKVKTNYNGWIGNKEDNDHQNENATLDGMHVGSTYNITATLNVISHALTMSKTFVKGTVHFDLQGHGLAISDLTNVTAGSKISAPGTPSATGYDFGGWYKEPACTNAWNFGSDVVNETMTLYAKWTAHEYTITKTLTNVTSSPVIPSTYTYTGAAAGLNYTISPSDGYRLPTEITVSGTTYTWNPATGALALTGTISSNVTITIVAVQTHKIDWYVGGSAPANKIGDDGQTTVVDHGGKIEDFPATTPDGSPCDKTFVGWTNTKSYTHGTSLLFNDVAGSPTIDADASFYAVFATGGDYSWTRVTSVATITGGGTFIIGYEGDYENNPGVLVPMQNANATATTSANGLIRCGDASNEFNNNTITMGSLGNHGGDDYEVIISEGTTSGTIAIQMADGNYIGKPTSGNNAKLFAAKGACTNITPVIGDDDVVRLKFNNDSSLQFNNNSSQYRFARYKNTQQDVVLYKKTGGLSGFTITCADCGTSVTPTYTASPTGGTVSVTKSATPVSSGSTVKTCTAVDLTVTLTPATHYDLTGFTATGLTTGTATITPAVGSTLPVSVAQTFTVTVSAGATGTLTLAPTFTAQTPLSITLETHSKGTFTPIGDVYSGESFTFPTVTPSDAECSSFLGWIEGTTWSGDGTETDPTAITGLANYHAAGSSSGTLTTTKTYTAVFGEKDTQVIPAYQKVTSAPSNWSGDYLIVRDANSRAFDGSLSTLDAADNYIGVTISEGSITANSTVNASKWTIAKVGETSNYTIKSASGYYIGRTASSNGLNSSTSEAYTNTLSYSDDHVVITSSGGPTLQMNSGTRFRYYTTSQQALQLYKYNPDAEVVSYTYTTNPACTPRYRVTISSATGGSPEADKTYEHADETITITANPAAGYSFTSWTITKTTGGDNVTSTLLTGDKPTTANTTFTMPAYDITIAATYTKKMVSTLEVKDGATVVSTTTGPVSGTVNISTGANKTLDVVITPSDAYDHSWTATVSAGSTYASITNVTDDGFRVNGLAQGDATITVNAPNDGSAKSVTLTVQVRDIMPEEIILKRDGSNTPIETLIMYYDETNSKGQYVKVNVGYSPANPTNKAFTFSSALTGKVGSHSHAPASGYEVLVANGVTSDAVNCTFTSSADGSVTKVLAVTVLPILSDRFVDYVHGNATQTVSARLSDDRYSIIPDINTPSLSDASDANPTSEDCETAHYHLVGWLPQTTAEALWAAGTPITDATEGLVRAGESVEATGQTWCAIWAEEQ